MESGRKERRGKRIPTEDEMRLRLAGLCARTEQSPYDLRHKILKAGLSAEQSDSILNFLIENRYLDERRFAKAYSTDKVKFSGWGRLKIRSGLAAKHIAPEFIKDALEGIDKNEYIAAIKRAGIAKAKSLNLSLQEDRAKFVRHLSSRGFETALVYKLLEAILRKY